MRISALVLLASLISCSGPVTPRMAESKPAESAAVPPADQSAKFPVTGQTRIQLVPDHVLGKDFLPGGNLADYTTKDGTYQMFLIRAADSQKAAFLLLDWKTAMPAAKYLAHMGGYYGFDGGTPIYVFAKGSYLAGIVGLTEAKADPVARTFAARL